MFKEESIWIKEVLEGVDGYSLNKVLDVGSSTKQFRIQTQPYIDENVFLPLRKRNISIFYLDKKNENGVDYVYDVEKISAKELGRRFDLVICCSLLEHVRKPKELCSVLIDLVKQDEFLLITVPQTYRHHPDPIDTMFRPSMEELISMFPGMNIIRKRVICIKDKEKYRRNILELIRYLIPMFNWRVNCVFMKKSKL
jgi:SAM-dependent methyltransferase